MPILAGGPVLQRPAHNPRVWAAFPGNAVTVLAKLALAIHLLPDILTKDAGDDSNGGVEGRHPGVPVQPGPARLP